MKNAAAEQEGKQAKGTLRAFALRLPRAREEFPWGERVIKVGKKVFVFMGMADGGELRAVGQAARQRPDGADAAVRRADGIRLGEERLGVRPFALGRSRPSACSRVDRRELPGSRAEEPGRKAAA